MFNFPYQSSHFGLNRKQFNFVVSSTFSGTHISFSRIEGNQIDSLEYASPEEHIVLPTSPAYSFLYIPKIWLHLPFFIKLGMIYRVFRSHISSF